MDPVAGETGASPNEYRGPQGTNVCTAEEPPSACDDGPFGKGKGGQLRYQVTVPAGASRTLWVAAAGSDKGPAAARSELEGALDNPGAQLAAKIAERERWGRFTRLDLPADERLAAAVDWGKQNLPTHPGRRGHADPLDEPGEAVPAAGWHGRARPLGGRRVPRLSVDVRHGRRVHRLRERGGRPVRGDRGPPAGAAPDLGHPQRQLWRRDARGGLGWVDLVRQGLTPHRSRNGRDEIRLQHGRDGQVPERGALLWRWTGDNAFRDAMYDFSKRNLRYVVERLDEDKDGWPEGSGNVERGGMGVEKLDNSVYLIRGLYDLADMARSKQDGSTYAWASNLARKLHRRFEATWWMAAVPQHADSIDDPPVGGPNNQQQDQHWIGVTPMEAELMIQQAPAPGLTTRDHGNQALTLRETDCYSGQRPYNLGLFHTGCTGGSDGLGERTIFGLNTAIQAVGEGNYGRLGPGRQQRYTDAEAEPMFGQPYTQGTPDEQPGALPEILPSPDFDRPGPRDANIDRCWTCRAMFVQAWGHYGTAWPVVRQQLGVRPDMGRRRLELAPQVPPGQPSVAGKNIRLADGALDVAASHAGTIYRTEAKPRVALSRFVIGHTLPHGTRVKSVRLDGRRVGFRIRRTNRGREVLVRAPTTGCTSWSSGPARPRATSQDPSATETGRGEALSRRSSAPRPAPTARRRRALPGRGPFSVRPSWSAASRSSAAHAQVSPRNGRSSAATAASNACSRVRAPSASASRS